MLKAVRHQLPNNDVRIYAILEGVPLWKLAEPFGVAENELDNLLGEELPHEVKEQLFSIIAMLGREEDQI